MIAGVRALAERTASRRTTSPLFFGKFRYPSKRRDARGVWMVLRDSLLCQQHQDDARCYPWVTDD